MAILRKTIYFDKPDGDNTAACLDVAAEALKEAGYRHIELRVLEILAKPRLS